MTATAVISDGTTPAPNYGREVVPEGVTLGTPTLVAPAGGTNPPIAVTTGFGGFTNGVATGTDFTWGEVGIITLTPGVADANFLGAGNAANISSGNIGRFTPDHFNVSFAPACSVASAFTYSGQPLANVTVTPYSASNGPINNYRSSATGFAKNTTISNAGDASNFSNNVLAEGAGGHFTGTDGSSATVTYTFAAKETAPLALTLRAVDTDNISSSGHVEPSNALIRSGRVQLQNAYGPELLNLPMPMTVQYYESAANGFVTHAFDTCTSLTTASLDLVNGIANPPLGTATITVNAGPPASTTATIANSPFAGGSGGLSFSAPGVGGTGYTDVRADLAAYPWLRFDWDGDGADDDDPARRATFGIYRGAPQHIYLRERY